MNRKIRVLAVIQELIVGGDENRLLTLAKAIDRSRFDFLVVTLKHQSDSMDRRYGSMRAAFADAGIQVRDLGEGHPNEGLAMGSSVRLARSVGIMSRSLNKLSRLVRAEQIDVIDGHLSGGNLVGVATGILTGRPAAVTTYHVEQWKPLWLWRLIHQATLGLADAIITDSQAIAEVVRRFMIKRDPRIYVIPNGVAPLHSNRSADEMRAVFGLPIDRRIKVVGQVSRLVPFKGHMVLLDAARMVIERCPDTEFLFVGFTPDAQYADRLLERARELGIADHIHMASYPDNIADVWQVINVHAHASLVDSLPNAIIEGMSLGKPAVVTAVGGIPSVVVDGRTGFVVPANDPAAFGAALLRLLENPELAKSMGDAARGRYETQYTPEIMARKLEDVFVDLAAKRSRRAPCTWNR